MYICLFVCGNFFYQDYCWVFFLTLDYFCYFQPTKKNVRWHDLTYDEDTEQDECDDKVFTKRTNGMRIDVRIVENQMKSSFIKIFYVIILCSIKNVFLWSVTNPPYRMIE